MSGASEPPLKPQKALHLPPFDDKSFCRWRANPEQEELGFMRKASEDWFEMQDQRALECHDFVSRHLRDRDSYFVLGDDKLCTVRAASSPLPPPLVPGLFAQQKLELDMDLFEYRQLLKSRWEVRKWHNQWDIRFLKFVGLLEE
jgi:hypothetical protein